MSIQFSVSVSWSGGCFMSAANGQEPGISNMLEHLYLDNNRDLQDDFGPRVHDATRDTSGAATLRTPASCRETGLRAGSRRHLSHFSSHADAVTGLAVSPDHMFFVSASDDETVKMWDTAGLERNVTSKPRHTCNEHYVRVKGVCMLEGVHC